MPPKSTLTSDPIAAEHRLFAFTLERIVFFSDAVFAIAITLLALDLRIPDLPSGQTDASFLQALARLGPSLFAFCISFVVIAAFWVGHYRTFRSVVDADGASSRSTWPSSSASRSCRSRPRSSPGRATSRVPRSCTRSSPS